MDDQSHTLVDLKTPETEPSSSGLRPGPRFARGHKWTAEEDRVLRFNAGEKSLGFILRKLPHRTEDQIYARLRTLGITLWQGTYTLRDAIRATGYAKYQLLRAREALGQTWIGQSRKHWVPGRSGSVYRITGEQLDALTEYLGRLEPTFVARSGLQRHCWADGHERCAKCGTNGSGYMERHTANGLCRRCYYEPRCPDCGAREWTLRALLFRAQKFRARKRRESKGESP